MASLNFKGKNIIWNHHLSVPYHTLEEDKKLSFKSEQADGNLLIEGDNLLALKALLPTHAGKIKCIYIDPPYNTGNEGWIYNDKVNSPLINEWFNKEVGKDDLTRHDKWLCMMTPRLKLLRELLTDDGIIFISIDDNEDYNLQFLMNEIFGEEHFISKIIWKRKRGKDNSAKFFSKSHEYLLCFAKNIDKASISRIEIDENTRKEYKNRDNDPRGESRLLGLWARGTQGGSKYEFTTKDGVKFTERLWLVNKETMSKLDEDNRLVIIGDNIYRKLFISEHPGSIPETIWEDASNAANASDEIKSIFGSQVFETPKPTPYIKKAISLCTSKDDIILDSFSGSGTTAQAVMELNAEDSGNRKFILVQMTEATDKEPNKNICKDITRERIIRVIKKHSDGQQELDNYFDKVGFKYKRVGIPIDAETMLSGQLPSYEELAKYVFYLAFGKTPETTKSIDEKSFYVGNVGDSHLYLIYKQNLETLKQMALNLETAETMNKKHKGRKVVYAPACFLDDEYLQKFNIQFVSIPYNLFETGNGK